MIKAIIIDWSGVVSDDFELVYGITKKMFGQMGRTLMGMKEFRESFDLPYMDFYRSMGVNEDKEKLDGMYKRLFVRSRKRAKPFPFARSMLEWLNEKGLVLSVFSSHPQEFLDREISEYGLDGIFSHAIGSVHDKRKSIGELVGELGAAKDEILMVGDMAHDIEAGCAAGILTAAVLSGYHGRKKLEESGPNFLLNDIRDLRFIVEGRYA